jgi:hypothetical protein
MLRASLAVIGALFVARRAIAANRKEMMQC